MGDEIINGDTRLPGEGDTYSSTMHRAECVLCGEPATRKYCWLLKGFRSNPQSKAYGRDDCTWCSDAEAFYCEPCRKAVSPKAAAEIPVAELLTLRAELVQYASDAYCTGLRIAQTTPCLGWEAKAKCGEYGKAEHEAHRDSDNWDGKHRGAWECIRRLDAVLDSPAAVSWDKQEKER